MSAHGNIYQVDQEAAMICRVGSVRGVPLRPLLMQSDLQSVENGAISTFARAFALKMCETAVSRLRMTWTILQDLSRAISRF